MIHSLHATNENFFVHSADVNENLHALGYKGAEGSLIALW